MLTLIGSNFQLLCLFPKHLVLSGCSQRGLLYCSILSLVLRLRDSEAHGVLYTCLWLSVGKPTEGQTLGW